MAEINSSKGSQIPKGKIYAVIDTGTMITLSATCLMNVFKNFIKENNLDLIISKDVARESVWKPIENKRFSLNAARIKKIITDGTLTIMPKSNQLEKDTQKILNLTNSIFLTENKNTIKILQVGEAEALAIANQKKCKILFVDERTTRSLIENPMRLKQVLERKQGKQIIINQQKLNEFSNMFRELKVFRSVDLIALAYEQNLFNGELDHSELELEAALYAAKYSGCAVSETEINEYMQNAKFIKIRP